MKYCPKCKGVNICKDGIVNHKHRYLCKHCNFHFTRKQLLLGKNNKPNLVKQAIQLHLENMSLRGIGRLLGIHNKTFNNWLKEEANKIDLNDFKVEESLVTELDEMHLYFGKKKLFMTLDSS
jgi:transposase-like protein